MPFFSKTYLNKTVLITGHTGFKGSWLSVWLIAQGAKVVGVSIDIPSNPSFFEAANLQQDVEDHRVDLRDTNALSELINKVQPDFVFHMAAQALVKTAYDDPVNTFSTNAMGTVNVLDALRKLDKEVVAILITSDKAYDNVEWVWGYRETDTLGGSDPYSASKGMAELAIRSYIASYLKPGSNVRVGVTRAGNVIGGGDWAKDRIVPDCMKAWSQGEMVDIRNPHATRPWQLVLEPLSGYLTLGAYLHQNDQIHGEAYNFGPPAQQNKSVGALIDEMTRYWDSVRWNDVSTSQNHVHEAGLLKLNCDKALFDLQWLPVLFFEETVRMTVQWYKFFYQLNQAQAAQQLLDFSVAQINEYSDLAQERNIIWTQ